MGEGGKDGQQKANADMITIVTMLMAQMMQWTSLEKNGKMKTIEILYGEFSLQKFLISS